ncbi:MAG: carotenoid biosynthesis protein, partial [Myxococcota bacterium]|nr:carotenoid biosynthesis protein [Myxococcota bacterium]
MSSIELWCVLIIGLYVAVRARRDERPARFLGRLGLLSVAAWLGEDSVIRVYGFYEYADVWTLWLDVTPVMIPLIWPVVIHSAWDLARWLLGDDHRWVPVLAAGFVFADAAFIEPIAVQAGLWRWTEPGLFAVPPIGILGWALFAVLAVGLLQREPGGRVGALAAARVLALAPVGCHLLLLAVWWGALRWVNVTVPAWPAVSLVGALGLV